MASTIKRWSGILGLLTAAMGCWPLTASAQVLDDPVTVPVVFQGMLNSTSGSSNLTITTVDAVAPYVTRNATASGSGTDKLTNASISRMRPGRAYSFTVTYKLLTKISVKITPPAGYRVFMGQPNASPVKPSIEREMMDWTVTSSSTSKSFTFTVRLDQSSGAVVGEATSLRPGRVLWSVGIGNLNNGKPGGVLSLAEDGLTANTFIPTALFYDRDSGLGVTALGDDGEVVVIKVGGVLRQLYGSTVFVDITAPNNYSYYIRFYSRFTSQISAQPDAYGTYAVTGTPLYEFKVENPVHPALTEIKITKTTNQNGTLVQWTKMTKVAGQPNQWLVHDWADSTVTNSPVQHRWTYTNSDLTELMEVMDGAGTVHHRTEKTYQQINFGEIFPELTSETVGSGTTAATTNYTYYTSLPSAGSWHKVKSTTSNDGSWSAMDYFDDIRTCGQLRQARGAFKNAPLSDPGTDAASGEVTTYSYAFQDIFGTKRLPTKVEVKVNGYTTAKTETDYSYENVNDGSTGTNVSLPVTVATQRSYSDASSYLTSYLKSYREDAVFNDGNGVPNRFFPGMMRSIERPDSTYALNLYYRTAFNGIGYSVLPTGEGRAILTLNGTNTAAGATAYTGFINTQSVPTNFYLVNGKATAAATYFSGWGPTLLNEKNIFSGSQLVVVQQDWLNYTNDFFLLSTYRRTAASGGYWCTLTNTWVAGRTAATVNETGISQSFTYDAAGRVSTIVRASASGAGATIAEQTTTVGYDAAGRTTSQMISGAGESMGTSATYDQAGRVLTQSSSGTGTTNYSYNVGTRTTTVTLPTTFTRIETRLLDGQLDSSTGTAAVPQYADYSVGADGKRYTKSSIGSSTSARKQESWADWLGRTTAISKPGFTGQVAFTEGMTYDGTTGKLKKVVRTGVADTLYDYNSMGEMVRSTVDISGGGVQLASTDRITETDTSFESYASALWITSTSSAYPFATGTAKVFSTTRKRLTGLSSTLRDETRSTDAEGSTAIQTTEVDSANKLITVTTSRPGMASNQVDKLLNGLSVSGTGHDGLTFSRAYDALTRATTITDPRAGATTTSYHANTPLAKEIVDAAGKRLVYTNYDGAGRPSITTDAYGKTSRMAYNARSQLEYQWGSAATPAMYVYDSYGQRTKLRTYRDTANAVSWDSSIWPGASATYSETEWEYDDPSGLLKKKYDNSRAFVEYAYNLRGQTYQRYWSRTYAGSRVSSTYGYDGTTGELTSIVYNDTTPNVSYSYTRLGQLYTATDGVTGAHDFIYDPTSPWRLSSEAFGAFYGSRVLSVTFDGATSTNTGDSSFTGHTIGSVAGRVRGYKLGTVGTPAADLEQTFAISNSGRIAGFAAKRGNGAASSQFVYGYEANSALLKKLSVVSNSFFVDRSYEPNRNLLTRIESKWSTTTKTRFNYVYDNRRQRESVVQSGDAYSDYGDSIHQIYSYSDRSEVKTAATYMGSSPTSQASPMSARRHEFDYDAVGNRKWSNTSGVTALRDDYTVNDLNQYSGRENNTLAAGGTANVAAKVVVGDNPVALSGRAGKHWGDNVIVNNGSRPFRGPVPTYAALVGAGANGTDLIRTESKIGFVPQVTQTFWHDADGNLTSDGVWDYQWDAENRLLRQSTTANAVQGGVDNRVLEFRYDYQNRRVQKKVFNGANSALISEQRFIYKGNDLIAELDSGGTLKRSYVWGLDLAGSLTATGSVGALVQIHDHALGKTLFPTYDGNGNVAALLNAASGITEAAYEYSPFGELLRCQGAYALANPFRFSTKFTDDESGLIYYGARYYSASLGRFINRDPIAEQGGLNLYGFCGNDGINGVDYLGQKSWFSKFWNKFRHTVVSAVLYAVPGVGPMLSTIYNTAVGSRYGGVKGGLLALASGGRLGSYAQVAATTYGMYQQFGHGKFFNNLGNFLANRVVWNTAYHAADGIYGSRGEGIQQKQAEDEAAVETSGLTEIDPNAKGNGSSSYILGSYDSGAERWRYFATDKIQTRHVFVNGIVGSLARHIELMGKHLSGEYSGLKQYTLMNNPTHGGFSDIFEAGLDILGISSHPARVLASGLKDALGRGIKPIVVGHSQGGAILTQAMRILQVSGTNADGMTAIFHGAASNAIHASSVARSIGVAFGGHSYSSYDAVGGLVGMNANAFQVLPALLGVPDLFGAANKSPHSEPNAAPNYPWTVWYPGSR